MVPGRKRRSPLSLRVGSGGVALTSRPAARVSGLSTVSTALGGILSRRRWGVGLNPQSSTGCAHPPRCTHPAKLRAPTCTNGPRGAEVAETCWFLLNASGGSRVSPGERARPPSLGSGRSARTRASCARKSPGRRTQRLTERLTTTQLLLTGLGQLRLRGLTPPRENAPALPWARDARREDGEFPARRRAGPHRDGWSRSYLTNGWSASQRTRPRRTRTRLARAPTSSGNCRDAHPPGISAGCRLALST
jgi:hypothetical protein